MSSAAAAIKRDEGLPLYSLPPADHVRLLHPVGRKGGATIASIAHERWSERIVAIDDLPVIGRAIAGDVDTFISQQSFFGWRRIAQLASLGAAYVDLDYHKSRYEGLDPNLVTAAVLRHLSDRGLPAPSYVLSTGRGLLCVWLHDRLPRRGLPRWQAVQRTLAEVLKPFGSDFLALDAARVFRISGTINSRADREVRPTWIGHLDRWSFDDLATEILPFTRAEIVILGAERARRRAERDAERVGRPTRTLTAATYWETVLGDLQSLRKARWFGELPTGQRDSWLFLATNAMSWIAPPLAMRRECYALAAEVGGWRSKECDARMHSIFRRASLAAAGGTIEWRGERIDPRYRFKASTMIEWLRIEPAEMRDANLRALITDDVRRERERVRLREVRAAAGALDRATYEAQAHQAAEDILKIVDRLGSVKAVAERLGISYDTAKKRIQRARQR
ncbi:hypothetical protein ACXIUS_29915 [Bosea thiooxidans]